jgi:hypothetical protein
VPSSRIARQPRSSRASTIRRRVRSRPRTRTRTGQQEHLQHAQSIFLPTGFAVIIGDACTDQRIVVNTDEQHLLAELGPVPVGTPDGGFSVGTHSYRDAMAHWINIVSRDHAQRGVAGGFTQANHGKPAGLKRMSKGDWIAFYSPKTHYPQGDPLQAFTAIGRVLDEQPYQVEMAPDIHPYRAQGRVSRVRGSTDPPADRPAGLHRGQEAVGLPVPVRAVPDQRARLRGDPCRHDAARGGRWHVGRMIAPREVPLGGPRALLVRRTRTPGARRSPGYSAGDRAPRLRRCARHVPPWRAQPDDGRDGYLSFGGVDGGHVHAARRSAVGGTPRCRPRHRPGIRPLRSDTDQPAGAAIRVFLGTLDGVSSPVSTFSPLLGAQAFEHGVLADRGDIEVDGTAVTVRRGCWCSGAHRSPKGW